MVSTATSLTVGEKRQLTQLEDRIQGGITAFVDVGQALADIRDKRLWTDYESFEEYCRKRWNFAKSQAYRYIESAKVVESLSPMGENMPAPDNERQVRELTKLESPQKQADAWAKAVETAPKDSDGKPKVTAKHVAECVKQVAPPAPKKSPTPSTSSNEPPPAEPSRGKPVIDVRRFEKVKSHVGGIVREMTDLKEHAGGASFHNTIRSHLNEILSTLEEWQQHSVQA